MLLRTIVGVFRSYESTRDHTNDSALKTRYFKISKEKAWEEIVTAIQTLPGYEITHEMKSVGEIVLKRRTFTGRIQDITLTMIPFDSMRISIDIHSASRGSLGDLGSNYRNIVSLYKQIDKKLQRYTLK